MTSPLVFPVTPEIWATHPDFHGMLLRDWFAGRAMQGIVSSIDGEDNYERLRRHAADECMSVSQWIARDAYKLADAMLAARESVVVDPQYGKRGPSDEFTFDPDCPKRASHTDGVECFYCWIPF
jgi:hypothetical protein